MTNTTVLTACILISLESQHQKLTLLEAREILDLCHRTLTGFYLSLATDITQDNFYSQVGIYFRDIHKVYIFLYQAIPDSLTDSV
jgi:hypothetical protein